MARRQRRPRGHIETRASGAFRAVVYAGVDPLTGKERYLKKSAPTQEQAEVELTKLQALVDEQRHPAAPSALARSSRNGSRSPSCKTAPASGTSG